MDLLPDEQSGQYTLEMWNVMVMKCPPTVRRGQRRRRHRSALQRILWGWLLSLFLPLLLLHTLCPSLRRSSVIGTRSGCFVRVGPSAGRMRRRRSRVSPESRPRCPGGIRARRTVPVARGAVQRRCARHPGGAVPFLYLAWRPVRRMAVEGAGSVRDERYGREFEFELS